ncbi:hypothetical protein [Lyngbya confervoides]|uniref:Transposase n=1 Tax=Lyngbya confervoides BDU141951 TaxID=1574623 RepID=A0ABD4T7L3_9CYAN|nr:hypothetical protein [Lyngbya confervoides]MCM1984425.1 hypothetical protein [Lyngbya confervoides BDU141951]
MYSHINSILRQIYKIDILHRRERQGSLTTSKPALSRGRVAAGFQHLERYIFGIYSVISKSRTAAAIVLGALTDRRTITVLRRYLDQGGSRHDATTCL